MVPYQRSTFSTLVILRDFFDTLLHLVSSYKNVLHQIPNRFLQNFAIELKS